ncbi:hypothetical protein GCM10009808_10700 [Microbacterium sediminicola]|uniref:non-specific serine/threonine protein kinase n=2 Tax=Microbacterium sediminicola TaxID=415210 RepID=A0ABN2HXU4_9MICO
MATVYVATDLRLERRIALKVMHGHLSDDTVFQGRFIQEARAAARLADPHVVNVFDQGSDGEVAYLVMEYLPGITLRELLRQEKRLTIEQTITVMDAVLAGLAAAHRAGIVHRDVKPENVLLAEDGRIKIGDFGLARATSANTATGQQLMGTIAYLAPELVTRGTADARSDIYSLGIMLYEMLAGEQPYRGEQPMQIAFQHATDSVPRPSVKNPGVPEQLDELVLWSTERQPDARPADAMEMLQRLREIERQLGVFPHTAPAANTTAVIAPDEDVAELTKVLPVATGSLAVPEAVDNAARLRRATRRQGTRAAWIIAIVIVLAALAAAAGWWFGSGPGSRIEIPAVAGSSYAEAAEVLRAHGLESAETGEYSLDVTQGEVIRTDPSEGSLVDKDTVVTVVVSLGPAVHEIPALGGADATQARTELSGFGLIVTEPDVTIFDDAAAGSVMNVSLTPRVSGDTIDCTGGCQAYEGDTVTLTVSVGAVPDVAGMSISDATSALTAKGLNVSNATIDQYDNVVPDGDVIGIAPREGGGAWQPGNTVTLIVSQGPEPIAVPDVVGMTIDVAVSTLESAGFSVNTDALPPSVFWSLYEVTKINPKAGTMRLPGSDVSITGFELGGGNDGDDDNGNN